LQRGPLLGQIDEFNFTTRDINCNGRVPDDIVFLVSSRGGKLNESDLEAEEVEDES